MLNPRQNQRGRSLLELIAVMAIMAMLAGISISWFKGAITRQEADRDYEDIQLFISAIRNRGTLRTDKGMADAFLSYKKTRSGKNLFKLDNCPQNTKGMTIQLDDIDDKTCERLMKKNWDGPFKPLLFLRAEHPSDILNWDGNDGAVYRLNTSADCVKNGAPEQGAFAVVFTPNSGAICADGYEYNDSTYRCDRNCGAGKYVINGEECSDCPDHANCDGKHFVCEDGYYWNDEACVECGKHVATCTDANTPTSCESGYDLFSGKCTFQCSKATDCTLYAEGNTCTSNFCGCKSTEIMTTVGCCPRDRVLNGACCRYGIKIDEATGDELCCNSAANQCCPPGQLYHGGTCHSCTEQADFNAFESSSYRCDACPNRVQSQYDCLLACRESDQIVVEGSCHCSTLERPIMPLGGVNKGKCVTCDQGGQMRMGSNYSLPLGYSETDIARYCNYRHGGGYINRCLPGTVGLSSTLKDKYLDENGNILSATTAQTAVCMDCSRVDYSALNSRARCESCGGTWNSTQPNTQDEWMHGTCEMSCANEYHDDCFRYDLETQTCQNKCKQVEWLEGNGTQYINTGIVPNPNTRLVGRMKTSSSSNYTSFYGGGGTNFQTELSLYVWSSYLQIHNGYGDQGNCALYLNTWFTSSNSKDARTISYENGQTCTLSGVGTKSFGQNSVALYGYNRGTVSKSKNPIYISSFKIFDGENLVLDLVPVLDYHNVPAMYDQVEKKLYYNAGTGTFSYGPVVN